MKKSQGQVGIEENILNLIKVTAKTKTKTKKLNPTTTILNMETLEAFSV